MYALAPFVTANPAMRNVNATAGSASTGVAAQTRLLTYLMVGTLGLATPDYIEKRGATSTWAQGERPVAPQASTDVHAALAPAALLDCIRKALKASVADTAAVFGVTRQALYNWRAGDNISAANLAKLEDLATAADLLSSAGLDRVPQLAHRKLGDGKTLLGIARDGGSASKAAAALIAMLTRENEQRDRLQTRLAGRGTQGVDLGDAGAPHLDEPA